MKKMINDESMVCIFSNTVKKSQLANTHPSCRPKLYRENPIPY